jgi:hypothetical protein
MAMATNGVVGADLPESLFHRLRFIEIATGTDDVSSLLWPCLEFEDFISITKDVKEAICMSKQEDMALALSAVRRLSSKQGMKGPVALLLGKTVPNQNRCVWFQGELLSFLDNFTIAVQSVEDVVGLTDAMEVTQSIIEAAMSTKDSTTEVIVTLDATPNKSNKATAVENPPDQGNAVEAKSTALNTSSSNDEEATVPEKASIDRLSKVEEVVAPKEQDTAQTQKTSESSSKCSSKEEAPKETSIKHEQEIVPVTTKTTRKGPKTAKAAQTRVSVSAALNAEVV